MLNRLRVAVAILTLLGAASCGSTSSGVSLPIEYNGTFTEHYEVTALWGAQGTCVSDVAEDGVLLLSPDGVATFTHPDRTMDFKHDAAGECQYARQDVSGASRTSSGRHDSKSALEVVRKDARGHNRTYTGSFGRSQASFSGAYSGEDEISGWRWSIRITASFTGTPAGL